MENQFSVRALAITIGIFWAVCVAVVWLINLIAPTYGLTFLWLVSSSSPGFHAEPTLMSILIGTAYALLEGMIAGGFIAWLYNLMRNS